MNSRDLLQDLTADRDPYVLDRRGAVDAEAHRHWRAAAVGERHVERFLLFGRLTVLLLVLLPLEDVGALGCFASVSLNCVPFHPHPSWRVYRFCRKDHRDISATLSVENFLLHAWKIRESG